MAKLYIVATPIGNTHDISERAKETLSSVEYVFAEDSRKTNIFLRLIGIKKSAKTYHHHSGRGKENEIINHLQKGDDVALVTDAGTPGISDPGNMLVSRVWDEIQGGEMDVQIIPIPGASAVTTILSACGFPTDEFYFLGFLPKKKGRQKKLSQIKDIKTVLVLYESPYRVVKTLEELLLVFGDVPCVVGRELTKKFEEINHGPISQILSHYRSKTVKGEFVLVLNNN
ncbi:MAG: 16S rRNA (cytidine(1402)-2'-O)-methyltransferase [Patescibacteria group bacterium]